MRWNLAKQLILAHIHQGISIDPGSQYRTIVAGPDRPCSTYNYRGALGFRVQIGANNHIEIPMSMLEMVYQAALANQGKYNNAIFKSLFPQQLKNHGCHVHVVGAIFGVSGIAARHGNNYTIQ